ncbi:hypothetical protein DMUE_4365 [Dictyocoela muelleri]|nr:hypothetical protein DMUE_4365 [Dictyocoela muelleri]
MEFYKTQRGKYMIYYEGFLYTKHKQQIDIIIWRCKHRPCPRYITLLDGVVCPEIVREHNCHSNGGKNQSILAKQKIMVRCKDSKYKFVSIFTSETSSLSTSHLSTLTPFANLRDYTARLRNIINNYR